MHLVDKIVGMSRQRERKESGGRNKPGRGLRSASELTPGDRTANRTGKQRNLVQNIWSGRSWRRRWPTPPAACRRFSEVFFYSRLACQEGEN